MARHLERLESRALMAVRTVDFADYDVRFEQLNFLMRDVGPAAGGLTYTLGTGDGQRTARNGVTWPDIAYYTATLGIGGTDALNRWAMRPVIIYTVQRGGDWLTGGWDLYQDMAEGPACVDDTARGATALMEDYLRYGTESSFQRARDALTYISYLMARDGRMYNFTFLDAPTLFNSDPFQSQNLHYGYRAEYVKRTQYPPGTGDTSWLNPHIDPDHIVGWPNPQAAPPFLPHARYSIYMNDLRDSNNVDVAATWQGPIYTSTGEPNGYEPGKLIKQAYTTSSQRFGFEEARTIEAYGKAMLMLAKRASVNGGLTADETYFARFIENHANRLLRNVQRQNLAAHDSKLQSALLAGLCDYYRVMHATSPYGPYVPRLAADSGTPLETTDDRLTASAVMTMIDTLATDIRSQLFRSSDWRNGIFINNATLGNWAAWGEFQIAALSKAYQLKRTIGQSGASVEALLNDAVYAAENFYGREGWHYSLPGPDNVRTKERTNYIEGWNAFWHTNSNQSPYYNSSIVLGLAELAEAYAMSGRADATAKRDLYLDYMKTAASWWIGNNNMLLDVYDGEGAVAGTTRGRGASFDGIAHGNGAPWFNRNSGGESNIEGLRTMVVVKDQLARYGKPTTFAFETGANRLPADQAPAVTSASFDVNARALRFRFNKDVGASVGLSDLVLTRIGPEAADVPRSAISVAYDPVLHELSYRFAAVLPDGNYRATLRGVGIVDNFSSIMLADRVVDFFVLAGDANRDRHVTAADQAILSANLGKSGSFSQGDFDYSGSVDAADEAILNAQMLLWLPPPGPVARSFTAGDDHVQVARLADQRFDIHVNGALAHRLLIAAGTPLSFDGGGGTDVVAIVGAADAGESFTFGAASVVAAASMISHPNFESRTFDGRGGGGGGGAAGDTLTVNGGAVAVVATQRLASLAVNGGKLDLRDHDIVIDYDHGSPLGGWTGSAYTGVTGMIERGRTPAGTWDGLGLVTTMPQAIEGVTTLGVAEAADVLFINGDETALWNGVTVDATTVIVKYTYTGDADLNGFIDAVDYGYIDNWIQFPGTSGYFNGDFNFDGVIDAADYGYIDNNIQVQGAPL